ncbi:MAG TPA: hypothetical protein VD994_20285 [Prosthecobacter sp.]|nr:hypothetical protein [Prosthecobacter sp.]
MTALRVWLLGTVLLAGLVYGQEARLKPWEEAALNAVKAINAGNADLFVAWAHPAELYRLKEKLMRRVLTPVPDAPSIAEQLKPYGVRTLEELARMPDAAFAAIAIPQQYLANDEVTREAMARATFQIVRTVLVEEDVYEVHIALHVPFEVQPLDQTLVALSVKDEAGKWKYSGLR